ncbi:TPA: hypothetical protein DDW69_02760 [candidate division CPR2 bacterium]|uniref:Type II secretion system protein GspG C-terminal domain-containing protein n=1 Tax=candidate division CPR2 bacterium GW2011_GWC1_41_48 TaxID=1618344 RepID=A0A0G0W882_UNCC2|nr:MAG: hypothetical protein UT47_C0003G0246 [candidate division CPR2 bacterium GW2011_GWC2_39_35]KKR28185.1 MAG: hypothetical protein UT59_C0033G0002 [candidate division CPR2 bacterium GW2011_GWD1_39_7]KKR29281.1 MAG: hypothetical protein UT60_C0004G0018 [candidate division CPR2 bacterium GW2011_GWD2_39_7]KKS09185.1 MAG: hypothetical protein UU65_C0003G0240 [candidate division CPR2 bacterium GW2011_GWC1_41_48]OGB60354.1 MAG: hypothetical protein A2Y27_03075 [candidate division CPR2 bacterium G
MNQKALKKKSNISEIIIVLIVLSTITALATGLIIKRNNQLNNDGKRKASILEIQKSLENYYGEEGMYPANLDMLIPNYLETKPPDIGDYPYEYMPTSNNITYKLKVKLERPNVEDDYVVDDSGMKYYQVESKQ